MKHYFVYLCPFLFTLVKFFLGRSFHQKKILECNLTTGTFLCVMQCTAHTILRRFQCPFLAHEPPHTRNMILETISFKETQIFLPGP